MAPGVKSRALRMTPEPPISDSWFPVLREDGMKGGGEITQSTQVSPLLLILLCTHATF